MLRILPIVLLCLCLCTANAYWKPKPGTSWQWQLQGTVNQSYEVMMYDIDLFDNSAQVINQLHQKGRVVICYFSAGSYEAWRPDAKQFPAIVKSKKMDGWDEMWLDITKLDILGPIMAARMDLAKQKGCDGIEPDNVDAFANDVRTVISVNSSGPVFGPKITAAQQIAYNRMLANASHARNLSVGLKNDPDQIPQLVKDFDWALNEQCNQYKECDAMTPFVSAGKAVFGVEYSGSTSAFCPDMNKKKFDWLKKSLDLKAEPFQQCRTYPKGPFCGDNLCSVGETRASCPADCS